MMTAFFIFPFEVKIYISFDEVLSDNLRNNFIAIRASVSHAEVLILLFSLFSIPSIGEY